MSSLCRLYVVSMSSLCRLYVVSIQIGFNVSTLTTAGTIANTGPPPTCSMRICNSNGDDINSAEIGDQLMLKVILLLL